MNPKKGGKEFENEKHGVIFAMFRGGVIHLENRIEPTDKYVGFTFVPGGAIEPDETQEDALTREIKEEYGVEVVSFNKIGVIDSVEDSSTLVLRHVFLVTGWVGELSNPEGRNEHIEATLEEARNLCKHPISQQILDLVEQKLSRQNS